MVFFLGKRMVLVQIAIAALSLLDPFLGFIDFDTPFTHRVNLFEILCEGILFKRHGK